jgi:hypothetical protein
MSLDTKFSSKSRLFGKFSTMELSFAPRLSLEKKKGTRKLLAADKDFETLSDADISGELQKSLTVEHQNAYLAGLIDGDGSIYCLLANRIQDGYKFGYEIRPCASITQRPEKQHLLIHANSLTGGIGTLRLRNDNIASLDFHGRDKVSSLVPRVKPYIYLKSRQARIILHVIEQMPYVKNDAQKFLNLCRIVDRISKENDGNNLKNTSETVREFLLKKGYQVV